MAAGDLPSSTGDRPTVSLFSSRCHFFFAFRSDSSLADLHRGFNSHGQQPPDPAPEEERKQKRDRSEEVKEPICFCRSKRSRSVTERKIKTDCCLCVFAGGGNPHRRRTETEERKTFLIHRLCHLHRRRREPMRRQWRGRVGRCAATDSLHQKLPALFLRFLEMF